MSVSARAHSQHETVINKNFTEIYEQNYKIYATAPPKSFVIRLKFIDIISLVTHQWE